MTSNEVKKMRKDMLDMGMEPALIDAIINGHQFYPDLLTDEEKLPYSSKDISTEGDK